MNENKIQNQCVLEFSQKYPELRGRLFGTFQNTNSKVQGGVMLSMGLVKGVSDLIYVDDEKRLIGIEIKSPGKRHQSSHILEQADWLDNCCYRGYFCTSVDMFWDIINGNDGILTEFVRSLCEGKKSIQF